MHGVVRNCITHAECLPHSTSQYMTAINTIVIKGPVISRTHRITHIYGKLGFTFVKGFEDILILS